jgi:type VI secretion system protein ImpH
MPHTSNDNDAWGPRPQLAALLRREPYRFGFFQAVRVLERLFPERQSVGGDVEPSEECARFRAHLSLVFPPSEIHDIHDRGDQRPLSVTVAFMGLTGPSGVLPRFYTETLLERVRQKDRTLADFLDLFNHRLISLFYRAWQKNRFWVAFERAEVAGRGYRSDSARHRAFVTEVRPRLDPFSQSLLELAGMGPGSLRYRASERRELRARSRIEDATLRFYAGLLAQQHRSASGLEGMLQDFFGVAVSVRQFVGQWLLLDEENQTQLSDGGCTQLGSTAIAGQRFWDVQSKFRVRIGPLGFDQFCAYLPSGNAYRQLADLARLYAGPALDIDLQLVLRAEEVPCCQLSSSPRHEPRLGWNTWVCSDAFTHDADDAVLCLEGSF